MAWNTRKEKIKERSYKGKGGRKERHRTYTHDERNKQNLHVSLSLWTEHHFGLMLWLVALDVLLGASTILQLNT